MFATKPQLEPASQKNPITDWVLRIGAALFFFAVGIDKFSHDPGSEWITIFARIGWGEWFGTSPEPWRRSAAF